MRTLKLMLLGAIPNSIYRRMNAQTIGRITPR
jgi:hypothetical protein